MRNTRFHYEISVTKNGVILRKLLSQRELFSFGEVYERLMELMFHARHQNIFEVEYCECGNNVAVFIWSSVDNVCYPKILLGPDLSLNWYLGKHYYDDAYLQHILGIDTKDLPIFVSAREKYIVFVDRSARWQDKLNELISDNLMSERKGALFYGA